MASKAVAKQEPTAVPALYTPKIEITAEDIALPKLKVGQDTSWHCKRRLVNRGDIFTVITKEDPDPQVLWEAGSEERGVMVHILDMYTGKSLSDGGELTTWYGAEMADAPPEAWTTWTYTVCLPEVDPVVPFKWLLTKSGKGTAQQINMILKKEEGRTPAYAMAFEFKTGQRSNQKGEWFVPEVRRVKQDDVPEDHINTAGEMGVMVSATNFEERSTGEDVAI